jgi:hypothetical protein
MYILTVGSTWQGLRATVLGRDRSQSAFWGQGGLLGETGKWGRAGGVGKGTLNLSLGVRTRSPVTVVLAGYWVLSLCDLWRTFHWMKKRGGERVTYCGDSFVNHLEKHVYVYMHMCIRPNSVYCLSDLPSIHSSWKIKVGPLHLCVSHMWIHPTSDGKYPEKLQRYWTCMAFFVVLLPKQYSVKAIYIVFTFYSVL